MLSNFIRRNGKRKGNKANGPRSQPKASSASSSLAPSIVFNISEESSSSLAAQNSRFVELNLPNANEEWIPQELLRRSSSRDRDAQNNLTQEPHPDSPSVLSPNLSENVSHNVVFRKKSIPAPILIPNADVLISKALIEHTAAPHTHPPIGTSQRNASHATLSTCSPSTSDNLSAVSGSTLARALIGSSFVLSSNERHNSRPRSGLARQDSATLPRGELGIQSESGKLSPIPPVPPVPAILVTSRSNLTSPVKSGSSTESRYPVLDSYITSPEMAIGSAIPQHASHAQGIPRVSASTKVALSVVNDTPPQRKTHHVSACTKIAKNGVLDGPETAVEVPLPRNSQATTQDSLQEGSDDHALDDFDFVPPEPSIASGSPNSSPDAWNIVALSKPIDVNRPQRKRKVGSNLTGNASKDSPLAGDVSSHPNYDVPSATMSEHDYGELLNYDLTVSPGSFTSSPFGSSGSTSYQTFPETPTVVSPLWSPVYSPFARSDKQVPRRRPQSIKSAGLKAGRVYSSARVTRRQPYNKDDLGGAVALRKSQSSSFPGPKIASLKAAESEPPLSVRVNDTTSIPEEANQSSTNVVESQKSAENRLAVRPHPLAHISSSSSYLHEEEALQALAPHSASSLPSITIDNVDTLISLMRVVAPVGESSVRSPISVPLPESTDGSPFDSPASAESATTDPQPTSPLQSSVPTATTSASSSYPSTSPLSPPSSSLGPSFLPSPSPSPLNESFCPVQTVSPSAVLDNLSSPSTSYAPPPPYHTIVSERIAYHPGSISTPSMSRTSSVEHFTRRSRQPSNSSLASGSVRSRVRARPPLPIGPRKPSGPGQVPGLLGSGDRGRNGSTSSVGSSDPNPGSLWRKIQSAVSRPPPKFQPPPPKWRGLTLEAAQWTFTSAQLQETVSRAIQQASEGSSLRLLRPEVLDGEIADEMHRLELQHMDVKAQYKALVRKRWTLMGALASHIEGVEISDATTACRTVEELAEALLTLDRLADGMHSIVLQMAQLKSLRDVHNASALAMAVRKINGVFVRQMAEKERLLGQVDTLQTERDEAWKQAEDIAQDYDTLNDRMSEGTHASADVSSHAGSHSSEGSRRSARVSALRKSVVRLSRAALRSRSKHRPKRSSNNATRPPSLASENIPPVPRLRVKPLSMGTTPLSALTRSTSFFSGSSASTSEGSLALAEAQREVYGMLGLSVPPSPEVSRRRRTLSGPDRPGADPPSASGRPRSESLSEVDPGIHRGRGGLFREDWGCGTPLSSRMM